MVIGEGPVRPPEERRFRDYQVLPVSIRVRLFAIARERAGASEVIVDLQQGATVADLRAALTTEVPALGPVLANAMIALNAEYASDGQIAPPSADVAVIPPVSGGAPC